MRNYKGDVVPLCCRTLGREPRLPGYISALFDVDRSIGCVASIVVVVDIVVHRWMFRVVNVVIVDRVSRSVVDVVRYSVIPISSESHRRRRIVHVRRAGMNRKGRRLRSRGISDTGARGTHTPFDPG